MISCDTNILYAACNQDAVGHATARKFRVWTAAGRNAFAFRRIFDIRLAETLIHHGVDTFATRNTKDFAGCGFTRLFDPCAST